MTYRRSLLVLFICAWGCGCTTASKSGNGLKVIAEPHVRVMTYNVNYGIAPEYALEAIQKADADIICMQETTPALEQLLRPQLSQDYPYMVFHHESYAGGMTIASRYPMEQLFYEMPPAGWFHGLAVKIRTDLGEMKFLSVHLRPATGGGGMAYVNYLRMPKVHVQEIEHLYKRLAEEGGNLPTVILGDFNELPDGAAVKLLRAKGLTSALREHDPYAKTWHWQTSVMPLSGAIDHILYSSQLLCYGAVVLNVGYSDHFPVVAALGMREKFK